MQALAEHLAWLGLQGCTCRYEWQPLGRLYGISMGSSWVRVETSKGCPHHDPRHNHFTRDIKPPGVCPACDRVNGASSAPGGGQ